MDTVRGSQQAVRHVAAAQNAVDAADPAKGFRVLEPSATVDVAGLVDAVEHGADLLSVRLATSAGYLTGAGSGTASPTRNGRAATAPDPRAGEGAVSVARLDGR